MRTFAGTGHRPPKLGGYGSEAVERLNKFAFEVLYDEKRHDPEIRIISGLALGWDQALAKAAIDLGIHLTVAIPFEGQERMWPAKSQNHYREMRAAATTEYVVSPGGYTPWKMQARNQWMVNHSDVMFALWDGTKSGGTYNCVRYARDTANPAVPINNLWERWEKFNG